MSAQKAPQGSETKKREFLGGAKGNSLQEFLGTLKGQFCNGLEKSHIGAKSDFEIWGFKGFFLWTQKKAPRKARRWPHLKS